MTSADNCEFFVVALPGLEDLVQREILEWFPRLEPKTEHGGVTVFAPLEIGLAMNQALKTATRILLRVDSFRCRDFPKLYNTVKEIDWKTWVDPTCELEVHVSTRLSRLKIKSRIEETCKDAWMDYRRALKLTAARGKKAALYVRFVEDQCTLSLDTSGERLHKRGMRENIGEAPLRETIAAALIQLVGADVDVVDPMMGSGTFLLEAATRDDLVEARGFAFERFARQPKTAPKLEAPRARVKTLIGFEKDAKAIKAAKANLEGLKGAREIELIGADFLSAEPLPPPARPRWLFCNPPYGERLKVKEPLGELYSKLFAAAEKVVKPERACFLLPSKAVKGRFPLPVGWKVLEKRPFLNGGIPVTAFVFTRIQPNR